ncbi:MAG TPA: phosphatase PAP2 family protein [Chloroflexaceae bacterium]|nr:phosphatase PAP2 family protein [Chloroflexaceae bacterium]
MDQRAQTGGPSKPQEPRADLGAERPEVRRRFALLRLLGRSPRLRHRLLLVAGLLSLAVVVALAAFVRALAVLPFDLWATQGLQAYEWAWLTRLMVWVSLPGYAPWSFLAVGVGTGLVALLLSWREGLYLVAVTAAQGLLNGAIKLAIGRPRPVEDLVEVFAPVHGFSFPSGHVMFYTVFFGFLAFLAWARLRPSALRLLLIALLLALVALVGPSRIVLGAHWLSDVIAAYLLGGLVLVLAVEGYLHYLTPRAPAGPG